MEHESNSVSGTSGTSGTASGFAAGTNTGTGTNTGASADQNQNTFEHVKEQAQNAIESGKDTAQDALGQVKDKAVDLKATIADRLEAGAQKLRQQTQGAGAGTMAGATAGNGGGTAAVSNDQIAQVADTVARGLDSTAGWLRNADLKTDIERQVRENPARTLLVAVGVGYLLGKALRR